MEEYERNIHAHIEKHGCSVTSVFDPKGTEPRNSGPWRASTARSTCVRPHGCTKARTSRRSS